jgi:hypothetical protein
MPDPNRLLSLYVPPNGFHLVSLLATTYQIDWDFFEQDLLPVALGVRSPISRMAAFRSELRRRLGLCEVTILYDQRGCTKPARLSQIDQLVLAGPRKQHAKITCLLWSRLGDKPEQPPQKRLRLIVGSANLTRAGFRENYEVVCALDYGGQATLPRVLLQAALAHVRSIADEFLTLKRPNEKPPQLASQLADLEKFAAGLPEGESLEEVPWRFVTAEGVVTNLAEAWTTLGENKPRRICLVSPFWPEGEQAQVPLVNLVQRFGVPARLELICEGWTGPAGQGRLPVLPPGLAGKLRRQLDCPLTLRPAQTDYGTKEESDAGDATEDDDFVPATQGLPHIQRALHAKLIVIEGEHGSVLYCGSSNLTRRGLDLGGVPNWEAGWIFRLSKRTAKKIVWPLLAFAGPPQEVLPDIEEPPTKAPEKEEEKAFPTFLQEIVSTGDQLTIRFRAAVPSDLVLVLENKVGSADQRYWLLLDVAAQGGPPGNPHVVHLHECNHLDENQGQLSDASLASNHQPEAFAFVRWSGQEAYFPLRYDDKSALPQILLGRRPTEAELIDYFLLGRVPGEGGPAEPGDQPLDPEGRPVDTSRILAYFMRRFVQALPGLEAELLQASHARAPLRAALFGSTSPVALAQEAYESMKRSPGPHEPNKTPTAVGFQLVEIIAALRRGRDRMVEADHRAAYEEAVAKCRNWLDKLTAAYSDLRSAEFSKYRRLFAEDAS